MDFNWWPHMNGFWIFPLFCLLLMVIMMFACGGIWSRFGHHGGSRHGRNIALQILERRYASGEIGKEQYDAVRHDLKG